MPETSEKPSVSAIARFQALMAAAAELEGASAADIVTPSRERRVSRSRQAAMWLAFKMTPYSLLQLGRAFGRHHTTVLYGIRAYERRLAADAEAKARSDAMLGRLLSKEACDAASDGAAS
jgi:chromosomal replication initiation ATPase DnaA